MSVERDQGRSGGASVDARTLARLIVEAVAAEHDPALTLLTSPREPDPGPTARSGHTATDGGTPRATTAPPPPSAESRRAARRIVDEVLSAHAPPHQVSESPAPTAASAVRSTDAASDGQADAIAGDVGDADASRRARRTVSEVIAGHHASPAHAAGLGRRSDDDGPPPIPADAASRGASRDPAGGPEPGPFVHPFIDDDATPAERARRIVEHVLAARGEHVLAARGEQDEPVADERERVRVDDPSARAHAATVPVIAPVDGADEVPTRPLPVASTDEGNEATAARLVEQVLEDGPSRESEVRPVAERSSEPSPTEPSPTEASPTRPLPTAALPPQVTPQNPPADDGVTRELLFEDTTTSGTVAPERAERGVVDAGTPSEGALTGALRAEGAPSDDTATHDVASDGVPVGRSTVDDPGRSEPAIDDGGTGRPVPDQGTFEDVAFEHEGDEVTWSGATAPRRAGRWLLATIVGAVALAYLFPLAVGAVRDLFALS